MNVAEQKRVPGSTSNGSSIVYVAPLYQQSDSENEDVENNEHDDSQEFLLNDDSIDNETSSEIRDLKAINNNLTRDYKILNDKYTLLLDKYNKLTKKMAREKSNLVPKPPPIVLNWMSNLIETVDKKEENANRSPAQCVKIIKDTAKILRVLPEQLKACYRDTMQKTARKLTVVVWPDPITRAGINAKNVCRKKLKLIYNVCEALHPDLEKNNAVLNTAIFNVCASTRKKSKNASVNLNVLQNASMNLNTTENSNIDDVDPPPLAIDEDDEPGSDDEEKSSENVQLDD